MNETILEETNVFELYKEFVDRDFPYIVILAERTASGINVSSNGVKTEEMAIDFTKRLCEKIDSKAEVRLVKYPLFSASQIVFKEKRMILAYVKINEYPGYLLKIYEMIKDL